MVAILDIGRAMKILSKYEIEILLTVVVVAFCTGIILHEGGIAFLPVNNNQETECIHIEEN
jgi:hypothetical protein